MKGKREKFANVLRAIAILILIAAAAAVITVSLAYDPDNEMLTPEPELVTISTPEPPPAQIMSAFPTAMLQTLPIEVPINTQQDSIEIQDNSEQNSSGDNDSQESDYDVHEFDTEDGFMMISPSSLTGLCASNGHQWGAWVAISATQERRVCSGWLCGAQEFRAITNPCQNGHAWGNWVTISNATCTTGNTLRRTCTRGCGASQTTSTQGPLGHSWSGPTRTQSPTCTAPGNDRWTCTRCGVAYNASVPALGHTWGEWVMTTPPICVAAGIQQSTCARCGATQTSEVPPLGEHQWGEWITSTPPTCVAAGIQQRVCVRQCGAIQTRETSPLGHQWGEWFVHAEPTTENEGVEKRLCARHSCQSYETRRTPTNKVATFEDWDGSYLGSSEVRHGAAASPPENPSRFGWEFTGWSRSFGSVTENITVQALYQIGTWEVIFKDWNETVLKTQTVEFETSASPPEDPSRYGYTFSKWAPSDFTIYDESNLYVIAEYTPNNHDFIFKNYDGTEHERIPTDFDTEARQPSDPRRYGWTFVRWDRDNLLLDEDNDIIVRPIFEINQYDVIFVDWDNTEIYRETVDFETAPKDLPDNPSREGHDFIEWGPSDFTVRSESDLIVRAQYNTHIFTVVFINYNGNIVSTQQVQWSQDATPPSSPTRSGYAFTKWLGDYTNVRENQIIVAQFAYIPVPNVPDIPNTPGAPNVPNTPNTPGTPSVPNTPNTPNPPRPLPEREQNQLESDEERLIEQILIQGEALGLTRERKERIIDEIVDNEGLPAFEYPIITSQIERKSAPTFTFFGREVYFFASFDVNSWALINLVLTFFGIALTVKTIIFAIKERRAKKHFFENADSYDMSENEFMFLGEDEDTVIDKIKWLAIGAILSISAVILFAVTQDLLALTALLDIWTIAHMALVIAQVVFFKMYKSERALQADSDD